MNTPHLQLVRRDDPHWAPVDVLRRREMRVLPLWWWLLVYTPRNHWSNHL